MYQNINGIDAVSRIDTIIDHSKVKAIDNQAIDTKSETKSSFNNESDTRESMLSKDYLEEMTKEASEALATVNTQLHFRVHEGTGRPLIQLVEAGTDVVVREIPSEKMLDIVAGIWEWSGLIVDRKE